MTLAVQARKVKPFPRRPVSFQRLVRSVADRYGQQAAIAWTKTVLGHQSRINEAALRAAITTRSLDRIARVVGAADLQRGMQSALTQPFVAGAQAAGQRGAEILREYGIGAQFNAAHPDVIQFARQHAAEAVVGVAKETKRVIAEVIARGAERGLTVVEQARAIREVVGLPPNWAQAPALRADELRAGQTAAATARRLSAATKQQIRAAIRTGKVTDAFVRKVQDEYTASLINRRALTIARTESIRVAHHGLQEGWRQAQAQGVLPPSTRKFWIVTPDERLSPEHARIPSMNPKGRKIEEAFVTTEGLHMYPPSRPNCRCGVALAFGGRAPRQAQRAATEREAIRRAQRAGAGTQPLLRGAQRTAAPPVPTGRAIVPPGRHDLGPMISPASRVPFAQVDTVAQVLERMGVNPRVVKFVPRLGASRTTVNGKKGIAVGTYQSGKIHLVPRASTLEVRGTAAHEATHLKFDVAVRTDLKLEADILRDMPGLEKDDGVTAYSRAHWQKRADWKDLFPKNSPFDLLAVNETLAEIEGMAAVGRHVGTARYRKLLKRVDKAYRKGAKLGVRVPTGGSGGTLRRVRVDDVALTEANAEKALPRVNLSVAQRAVVKAYAQGSAELNAVLRKGPAARRVLTEVEYEWARSRAPQLEALLRATPRVRQPVVVWRGVGGSRWAPKVGTVFRDQGFVSTALRVKSAEPFAVGDGVSRTVHLMRITVPKGARGLSLKGLGGRAGESEFLLPNSSKFRVRKKIRMTLQQYADRFTGGKITPELKRYSDFVIVHDLELIV